MNKPLVLAALALFLALPVAQAQMMMQSESLDGIVAVVDEDVILRSELDRAVDAITAQYARSPQQLPPRAELERQVLDRLILMRLQVERADSTGIKLADAEVDQTISQIANQNRLSVGQLRQAVMQQGLSWEAFRKNVHDETIVQRLRQRVVQSRVQVSDTEIDLMLKNGGVSSVEVHLGHIFVGVPDGATSEQIQAAQAKAEDVSRQIAEGLDFTAAAIRYSDAQNALDGGNLGWRSVTELPQAFADATASLSPGQTTGAVRGPNGFHILKLLDRRSGAQRLVTEYHARHILIKKSELTSSEQARTKIEELRRRALSGEDFAELAREHSEDAPTSNIGGDMGWFQVNAWGTAVGNQLMQLQDGQLSEAFQTDVGWHLIQRLGTRQQDVTEKNQRNRTRETIARRKAEEEYDRFLRQLRSEAYIDSRLPGALNR